MCNANDLRTAWQLSALIITITLLRVPQTLHPLLSYYNNVALPSSHPLDFCHSVCLSLLQPQINIRSGSNHTVTTVCRYFTHLTYVDSCRKMKERWTTYEPRSLTNMQKLGVSWTRTPSNSYKIHIVSASLKSHDRF